MARPSQRNPSAKDSQSSKSIKKNNGKTCLVDIDDFGIHYFTLEGFHDDGGIPCFKFCLTGRWDNLPFTYICDGNDGDDIPFASSVSIDLKMDAKEIHTHVYRYMSLRHPHIASDGDSLQAGHQSRMDEVKLYE